MLVGSGQDIVHKVESGFVAGSVEIKNNPLIGIYKSITFIIVLNQ